MILVTGGLGFIGLHTARSLMDCGEQVVLTQYRVLREPDFIKRELGKNAFIEQLDITDGERFMQIGKKYKITGIVHMAVPAREVLSPSEDFGVNMYGLRNVMECGRVWEVNRICLASSQAVYARMHGPYREDMLLPMTATNPTEAFKKAFEILGGHFGQQAGVETVSLRLGGIYGPLYHSGANNPYRMVHAALKGVAPVWRAENYADDGVDICYGKDAGRGVAYLQTAKHLNYNCYNVSGGRLTTNRELVEAVQKQVPGFKVDMKDGIGPRTQPNDYSDTSRLQQDTPYKVEFPIDKAIADYIAWIRAGNPE